MTTLDTFRLLEESMSINPAVQLDSSSLGQWYTAVRDIPLVKFDISDLAIACRQKLFIEQIVPETIARLIQKPFAGSRFDGELMSALIHIPSQYWEVHKKDTATLKGIIGGVIDKCDEELRHDLEILYQSIQLSSPRNSVN